MADPEICSVHDCTKKLNPNFKSGDVKEEEKAFPLSLWICPECETERSRCFTRYALRAGELSPRPAA
jgi:hypothetical protein